MGLYFFLQQSEIVSQSFFSDHTFVRTDQAFLIYVHNGQYLIAQQGVIINYFQFSDFWNTLYNNVGYTFLETRNDL